MLMLRIQQYNIDVKYKFGRDIPISYAPYEGDTIKGLHITVHELQSQRCANPIRLVEIREETVRDIDLFLLGDMIVNAWPDYRRWNYH